MAQVLALTAPLVSSILWKFFLAFLITRILFNFVTFLMFFFLTFHQFLLINVISKVLLSSYFCFHLVILSGITWTGYLACARCSASGVCLNINPISASSATDRPLRVPTTERCPNCSGAGKVQNLSLSGLFMRNDLACRSLLALQFMTLTS